MSCVWLFGESGIGIGIFRLFLIRHAKKVGIFSIFIFLSLFFFPLLIQLANCIISLEFNV